MLDQQSMTEAVANGDMMLTEDVAQAIAGEYLGQLVIDGAKALWRFLAPESTIYADPDDIRNSDTPSL